MKKILILLSSSLITTTASSNLNLSTITYTQPKTVEKLYSENWTNKLNSYIVLKKKSTKYFNKKIGISYEKFGSLDDLLNSNAIFNLNTRFESRIGVLSKYKNYNDNFNKNENISILKPYLNNWVKVSEVDWTNWMDKNNTSKAEIDMSINDDTQSKIIFFNFKSVLVNAKNWDTVYNYMY